MSADSVRLTGVSEAGDSLLSDQLEFGLWGYFNWAFLGVGAFTNVTIPASGQYPYGAPRHRLRMSEDPNYLAGQVWEGFRKDWVWETGVDYRTQPIRVSGVYVGGGFHPLAPSGPYAHHVDYPLGRVVFDAPLPASSVVTCEYSYRSYQFYTADAPFWHEAQAGSLRGDDPSFLLTGSGSWSTSGQNRIQLPAVVVEADLRTDRYPLEIGGLAQVVRQDVLFHVIAETRPDVKRLHDALTYQKEKRIDGIDKNALLAADAYPLDANGSPVGDGRTYPDLCASYFWKQLRFVGMRSNPEPRVGGLHMATVRATVEVDLP